MVILLYKVRSVTNAVELFTGPGAIIYSDFIVPAGILNINTANSANSINIYGDLLVHTNGTFTRTGQRELQQLHYSEKISNSMLLQEL